jgi:hypothetical protein
MSRQILPRIPTVHEHLPRRYSAGITCAPVIHRDTQAPKEPCSPLAATRSRYRAPRFCCAFLIA